MAPKIYHLHPLVAGPLSQWSAHFARCRAMGFDTVCVAPPFAPGASGDIFITADAEAPETRFLAWTPGVERAALSRLEGVGFDHVCCSLAWWDGRSSWLVEEVETLRRIAPVIASPEPSFFERRAARVEFGGDVSAA